MFEYKLSANTILLLFICSIVLSDQIGVSSHEGVADSKNDWQKAIQFISKDRNNLIDSEQLQRINPALVKYLMQQYYGVYNNDDAEEEAKDRMTGREEDESVKSMKHEMQSSQTTPITLSSLTNPRFRRATIEDSKTPGDIDPLFTNQLFDPSENSVFADGDERRGGGSGGLRVPGRNSDGPFFDETRSTSTLDDDDDINDPAFVSVTDEIISNSIIPDVNNNFEVGENDDLVGGGEEEGAQTHTNEESSGGDTSMMDFDFERIAQSLNEFFQITVRRLFDSFWPTLSRVRREARMNPKTQETSRYFDSMLTAVGAVFGQQDCRRRVVCNTARVVKRSIPGSQVAVMLAEPFVPIDWSSWFRTLKSSVLEQQNHCIHYYQCDVLPEDDQQRFGEESHDVSQQFGGNYEQPAFQRGRLSGYP